MANLRPQINEKSPQLVKIHTENPQQNNLDILETTKKPIPEIRKISGRFSSFAEFKENL